MSKIEYLLEWPVELRHHHIAIDGKILCGGAVAFGRGADARYVGAKPCWMEFCPTCERKYAQWFLEGNLVVKP
jgi:hypothetical protein